MKKIAAAILITLAALSQAQGQSQPASIGLVPLGYQQLTSLASATALTVPTGATIAVISAESQAVRYRDDGTNPSATVGMPIASGATITYTGQLSRVKLIEQTASAKVNVLYYK